MPTTPPLITHHSSLITYHSKYPNFLRWHVWNLFPTFDNSKKFYFLWDPLPVHHVKLTVSLPASHTFTPHFILFFPFGPVIYPKHSSNLVKEIKVWTCGVDLHRHLTPPTSCASSPNVARSPPTCSGDVDLLYCDPAALINHHGNVL